MLTTAFHDGIQLPEWGEYVEPEPVSIEIQREAMIAVLDHLDPAQLQPQIVGLYRHGLMTASWCFARLKQAELIGDIDDVIEGYMIGLAYMQEERERAMEDFDRQTEPGDGFASPEPTSQATDAIHAPDATLLEALSSRRK